MPRAQRNGMIKQGHRTRPLTVLAQAFGHGNQCVGITRLASCVTRQQRISSGGLAGPCVSENRLSRQRPRSFDPCRDPISRKRSLQITRAERHIACQRRDIC